MTAKLKNLKFLVRLKSLDDFFILKAKNWGHGIERYVIALLFIWFGALKFFGELSASSIIGKSVYWWEPEFVVPMLGLWEQVMGLCLMFKKTTRIAVGLFFLRLPGTFLALIYHSDKCFDGSIFIPTIQGQYLIKELTIVGAALIIASGITPLGIKKLQLEQ